MRHAALAATLCLLAHSARAEPAADYAVVAMSIDVNRPAAKVWARVGKFCDLGEWLKIDCVITKGEGGIGSVRAIAGGRVIEVMVAKTDLSYGYAQPAVAGKPYDLYHGFLEARPLAAGRTRLLYTLTYDAAMYGDKPAQEADIARRRTLFTGALAKMKSLAETH